MFWSPLSDRDFRWELCACVRWLFKCCARWTWRIRNKTHTRKLRVRTSIKRKRSVVVQLISSPIDGTFMFVLCCFINICLKTSVRISEKRKQLIWSMEILLYELCTYFLIIFFFEKLCSNCVLVLLLKSELC